MLIAIEVDEKYSKLREQCLSKMLEAIQESLHLEPEGGLIFEGDFYESEIEMIRKQLGANIDTHIKVGGKKFHNYKFIVRSKENKYSLHGRK